MLKSVKLDVIVFYWNLFIVFVGMVLIGIVNGVFGMFGVVFGVKVDFFVGYVVLMMSFVIVVGVLI